MSDTIDMYARCNTCGAQQKSTMENGGSLSAGGCPHCGSPHIEIEIGNAEPPEWYDGDRPPTIPLPAPAR